MDNLTGIRTPGMEKRSTTKNLTNLNLYSRTNFHYGLGFEPSYFKTSSSNFINFFKIKRRNCGMFNKRNRRNTDAVNLHRKGISSDLNSINQKDEIEKRKREKIENSRNHLLVSSLLILMISFDSFIFLGSRSRLCA